MGGHNNLSFIDDDNGIDISSIVMPIILIMNHDNFTSEGGKGRRYKQVRIS